MSPILYALACIITVVFTSIVGLWVCGLWPPKRLRVGQEIMVRPMYTWKKAVIQKIENGEVLCYYGEGQEFSFYHKGWQDDSQVKMVGDK